MKDLNTPLLDMVNRKLVETHIDCANPFAEVTQTTAAATTTTISTTAISTETTKGPESSSTTITTSASTEKSSETTESTDATTTIVTTEATTTDTTEKASDQPETALNSPKRKPIKRQDKKLDVPYRPPLEEKEL